MNFRVILLCAVILVANSAFAREKTDVIIMKNGDRITCEIKALTSNTLYISVSYILGTLSVDWDQVDHLESNQLFLVKTQDGTVYTGTLSTPETPGGRPLQIEIVENPEKNVTLERRQVVNVRETAATFWERVNGQIGTGFTYSKGNQSTQYNLNSDVNYPGQRWYAGVSYGSNFVANTGASTATRNEVTFGVQRLMRWNNWYYVGLADFLQSSVQGIQIASTYGGGIGRYLKNTGHTTFKVYGGFAWQRISYQEAPLPSPTQHVTAALFGANLNLFEFDKTTLAVSAIVLPALSQPGRVHFNLNASYYVKLFGKLDWNFTVYGNWDNRPPPGFVGSDYGTTSGLSLSFGPR
jgi:Protein of unknown function, DUF481